MNKIFVALIEDLYDFRVIVALVDAFHFDVSDGKQREPVIKRRKENGDLEIHRNDIPDERVEVGVEEVTAEVDVNDTSKEFTSSIYQKVVGYLIPRLKDCATSKVSKLSLCFSTAHDGYLIAKDAELVMKVISIKELE